jgi:hypothetical protein
LEACGCAGAVVDEFGLCVGVEEAVGVAEVEDGFGLVVVAAGVSHPLVGS